LTGVQFPPIAPWMITLTRLFSVVLGMHLLLAALAGEDAPTPRRVLILTNESTYTGQIEQEATGYRVKNETGELVVPAKQVLRVCASMEEAYEFLKSRANLRDPHERLRLAKWCWNQNLPEHARAEAEAAVQLAPKYVEAQRLLKTYAESRQASPPTATGKPSSSGTGFASGTGEEVTSRTTAPKPLLEHSYSAETLQTFTRKVQPILFNGCGTGMCHGGPKAGGYELQRPFGNAGVPSQMTRQNLLQTLSLVEKDDPQNSALLRKALERHGGGNRAPFAGKDAVAYQTLEAWAYAASGVKPAEPPVLDDPDKKDAGAEAEKSPGFAGTKTGTAAPPAPTPLPTVPLRPRVTIGPDGRPMIEHPNSTLRPTPPERTPGEPSTVQAPKRPPGTPVFQGSEVVGTSAPEAGDAAAKLADPAKKQPKEPPKPVDPFDPIPFNRQYHPERNP
jgi:hypothetical protein